MALPDCLRLHFDQLLGTDLQQVQSLHTAPFRAIARRWALLGPVLSALQLLEGHWTRNHRMNLGDGMHVDHPLHKWTAVARLLLAYVAEHDRRAAMQARLDTREEGAAIHQRPPALGSAQSSAFQAHVERAFNSMRLSHDHGVPCDMTQQFIDENTHAIKSLKLHSGYYQARSICLNCLVVLEEAGWRHRLTAAMASVSTTWRRIFEQTSRSNRTAWYLAKCILADF